MRHTEYSYNTSYVNTIPSTCTGTELLEYYLRSIPLVRFDFLVEEILAFHRNVIQFL